VRSNVFFYDRKEEATILSFFSSDGSSELRSGEHRHSFYSREEDDAKEGDFFFAITIASSS
jgi:hypothetical protein